MPPKRSLVSAYSVRTRSSSATSTSSANALPSHAAAVSSAAAASTSATQTRAPSLVKSSAASRPIPPPAPVITATLPSSRLAPLITRIQHDHSERKRVVKEFKEFLLRGNLVDTAVGIVIGLAFAAVITALVK